MSKHFRKQSSIELLDFLRADVYTLVLRAMKNQCWRHVGPANVRHYKVAEPYPSMTDCTLCIVPRRRATLGGSHVRILACEACGQLYSHSASNVLPSFQTR